MRALLRISRRQILRQPFRSLAVVVMIAVPVTAVSGLLSLVGGTLAVADESVNWRFGTADMRIEDTVPGGAAARTAELGATEVGTERSGQYAVDRDGAALLLDWTEVDLTDPDLEGYVTLRDGRLPERAGEALSAAAGPSNPDLPARDVRIVGTVANPRLWPHSLIAHPGTFPATEDPIWATSGLREPISTSLVRASPNGVLSAGPMSETRDSSESAIVRPSAEEYVVFALVAVVGIVWCALLASAALAIGTRRRRRELGLIGTSGASTAGLRHAVMADGVVLGLIGAVAGLGAGLVLARIVADHVADIDTPWTLTSLEARFTLPVLAAPAAGWLAAIVAGALAARGITRQPLVDLLRGRAARPAPAPHWFLAGVVFTLIAAVSTIVVRDSVEWMALTAGCVMILSGVAALICLTTGSIAVVPTAMSRASVTVHVARRDLRQFGLRTASATAVVGLTMAVATGAVIVQSEVARFEPEVHDEMATGTTAATIPGPQAPGEGAASMLVTWGDAGIVDGRIVGRPPSEDRMSQLRSVFGSAASISPVQQAQMPVCADNMDALVQSDGLVDGSCLDGAHVLAIDDRTVAALDPDVAARLGAGELVAATSVALPETPVNTRLATLAGDLPLAPVDPARLNNTPTGRALMGTGALTTVLLTERRAAGLGLRFDNVDLLVSSPDPIAPSVEDVETIDRVLGVAAWSMNGVEPSAASEAEWYVDDADDEATYYRPIVGSAVVLVLLMLTLALVVVRIESHDEDGVVRTHGGTPVQRASIAGWRALLVCWLGGLPGVGLVSAGAWILTAGERVIAPPAWWWLVALVAMPILAGALFFGGEYLATRRSRFVPSGASAGVT